MAGTEIRRARKARGWTQAQLAQAVGTTQGVISELERDLRPPNLATLERVAAALGLVARVSFVEPAPAGVAA